MASPCCTYCWLALAGIRCAGCTRYYCQLSERVADEERKCLEEQLEAGVIRSSSSPWAAPTVLARNSDGSVCWCIDYRKLNDRCVKDAYPLQKISMCLDSLGGTRYFTTLDLQSGYWQIGMAESAIPKPDSSPNMDFVSTPRCRLACVHHPPPFSGAWSSSSGACIGAPYWSTWMIWPSWAKPQPRTLTT